MIVMRIFVFALIILSFIFSPTQEKKVLAAVSPEVVTPEALHAKYDVAKLLQQFNLPVDQKIRVLIVSGHDDDVPGTAFGDLQEVDFNRVLGEELFNFFKEDTLFEPILTQTKGGYIDTFENYFEHEEKSIEQFISSSRRAMQRLMRRGKVEPLDNAIHHNKASDLVVHRLYGINKWANENNVDLILHIHFNDYPGRPAGKVGKYSGFTIYIPDEQLQNGKTSQVIAPYIFSRLFTYIPVSDLGGESGGITRDLELIAIGSNNTLVAPSLLIEYSYMYEPHLREIDLRETFLKEYAKYTYEGVKNFFEKRNENPIGYDTTFLPYIWMTDLEKGMKDSHDVAALQLVLRREGIYPGIDKTLTDCPINGSFGPCTERAVKAFQERHGISQTGTVGPMTRAKLNELFGK